MDQTSDATGRWPGQVLRAALGKPTPAPCGAGDLARRVLTLGCPGPCCSPLQPRCQPGWGSFLLGFLPPPSQESEPPPPPPLSRSPAAGGRAALTPCAAPRGCPPQSPPQPQGWRGSELCPGEAPAGSLFLSSYGTAGRAGAAGAGAAAALAPEKTTKINMGWRGRGLGRWAPGPEPVPTRQPPAYLQPCSSMD